MKKIKREIEVYHWFFIDIVASADPDIPVENQIKKIEDLNTIIHKTAIYKNNKNELAILPTGDGAAIGFPKNPENPLLLAIQLHKLLYNYNKKRHDKNKISVRIGIESGLIRSIRDFLGRDAFWGPGIILAKRVMDIGDGGHILTSEDYAKLRNINSKYKKLFRYCGVYPTRHERIPIYNIYGNRFGNKKTPDLTEKISPQSRFFFNKCEIEVEVKNSRTNLTHGKWIWNVKNPSDESMNELSVILRPEYKTKFTDLKFKITDNKEKNHKAVLFENIPFQKTIKVMLKKPVKPRQTRLFKIEYDVKEPMKHFIYTLGSDCKQFVFKLVVPKKIKPEQVKLFKIDMDLGNRVLVAPSPTVRRRGNKIEYNWKKYNVKMHDTFEYRW